MVENQMTAVMMQQPSSDELRSSNPGKFPPVHLAKHPILQHAGAVEHPSNWEGGLAAEQVANIFVDRHVPGNDADVARSECPEFTDYPLTVGGARRATE